jgi:hypothetical protein
MQALTLTMIVVVTTFEFLSSGDRWGRWAILPSAARFMPELLSAAAVLVVLFAGVQNRFRYVRPEYWLLFAGLVLVIICGVVANQVEAGPVIAGMRNYLRAIVWFFIPAVLAFTEANVRQQLKVLLCVAVLQLPLATQQFASTVQASAFAGMDKYSGDYTVGSLTGSGTMSVFLIGSLCVLAAFYTRRIIGGAQFAVLCLMLFAPMTLNETKAVIVLLPIGLAFVFFAAAVPGRRLSAALKLLVVLLVFGTIFVPVYDYLKKDRPYAVPISEFVTDPERIDRYLRKGADVGTTREVGRLDAIAVTANQLSEDPVRLAFGYGIGNVSKSALGHGFTGEHFGLLGPFATLSITRLALELGLFGVSLVLALMYLVLQDSQAVARHGNGTVAYIAVGWVGVVIVIGIAMAYMDVMAQPSLSYLFWYLSGLIAAERIRARAETPTRAQ